MSLSSNNSIKQNQNCPIPFYLPTRSTPQEQQKEKPINTRVTTLFSAYHDKQGNTIQLWKHKDSYCGSVVDQKGSLTVIPGTHIQNSLNPQEPCSLFLRRIERFPTKSWEEEVLHSFLKNLDFFAHFNRNTKNIAEYS